MSVLSNLIRMESIEDREARQRAETQALVRDARIAAARNRETWDEIPETRLVKRGPLLVDAETDRVYLIHPGDVFVSGRADIDVPRETRLAFYVNQDERLVFLEPFGTRTWTEHLERKARR